jgi:hypothetical protein
MLNTQSVGKVINIGEQGSISLIVTSYQHVYLIGIAGSQVISQVFSGEVGSSLMKVKK